LKASSEARKRGLFFISSHCRRCWRISFEAVAGACIAGSGSDFSKGDLQLARPGGNLRPSTDSRQGRRKQLDSRSWKTGFGSAPIREEEF